MFTCKDISNEWLWHWCGRRFLQTSYSETGKFVYSFDRNSCICRRKRNWRQYLI